MRNTVLALCLLLLAVSCSSNKEKYVINGTIPSEYNGRLVYMTEYDNNSTIDSTVVADGKFSFTGDADRNVFVRLQADRSLYANVILESGNINVDLTDFQKIGGTPLNDEMAEYLGDLKSLYGSTQEERTKIFEEYPEASDARYKLLDDLKEEFNKKHNSLSEKYFTANADNGLGKYVFLDWHHSHTPERVDEIYARMGKDIQNSPMVQKIIDTNEKKKQTAEGQKFTDFTIENGNMDGTSVSFSDYIGKGKYVLVDFWASWCGPCIAENPTIAEVYNKYRGDKFDVLGVAVWDERDATLGAILQHGITWPQIIDAQDIPTDLYGISGIPHIILFGPDGTILARNLRGEGLKTKVAEVMK